MYKKILDMYGNPTDKVIMKGDTSIPNDPTNVDYQEYLKWLEEGNTPEQAD